MLFYTTRPSDGVSACLRMSQSRCAADPEGPTAPEAPVPQKEVPPQVLTVLELPPLLVE